MIILNTEKFEKLKGVSCFLSKFAHLRLRHDDGCMYLPKGIIIYSAEVLTCVAKSQKRFDMKKPIKVIIHHAILL